MEVTEIFGLVLMVVFILGSSSWLIYSFYIKPEHEERKRQSEHNVK